MREIECTRLYIGRFVVLVGASVSSLGGRRVCVEV
jgi:hypothetical protein